MSYFPLPKEEEFDNGPSSTDNDIINTDEKTVESDSDDSDLTFILFRWC